VAFDFTGNSTGYVPYAGLIIDLPTISTARRISAEVMGPALSSKMTPEPAAQLTESFDSPVSAGVPQLSAPTDFLPSEALSLMRLGISMGQTELGGGASVSCNQGVSGNFRVGCGVVFKLTPSPKGTWEYILFTASRFG